MPNYQRFLFTLILMRYLSLFTNAKLTISAYLLRFNLFSIFQNYLLTLFILLYLSFTYNIAKLPSMLDVNK